MSTILKFHLTFFYHLMDQHNKKKFSAIKIKQKVFRDFFTTLLMIFHIFLRTKFLTAPQYKIKSFLHSQESMFRWP